jgi:hypothetical protein
MLAATTTLPPAKKQQVEGAGKPAQKQNVVVAKKYINYYSVLITHISKYLQVGTYSVLTSRYLPLSKPSTYLVTTKLGQTQQYTLPLLIAITLAMSSAP